MMTINQQNTQDERSAREYLVEKLLSLARITRDRRYALFLCDMARFSLDEFAGELNEVARHDETAKLPHNLSMSLGYAKIELVESEIDRKFQEGQR